MTSAVLPSQNEHRWSENMRQFSGNRHFQAQLLPTSAHGISISRPNVSLAGRVSGLGTETAFLSSNVPPPRLPSRPAAMIGDAPLASRSQVPVQSKDSFRREHVTFHLSSYTKSELVELKMRLNSDLERVRAMLTRIHNREFEARRGLLCPKVDLSGVEKNQKPADADPPADERQANSRPPLKVAGSGKINPKIGGHKRVVASAGDRETKRTMAAATKVKAMNKCKNILNILIRQRYGYVFSKPVDVVALQVYDYYEVIKYPMDLGTIKKKLEKNEYKSPQHFAVDVRLTFDNAMIYNSKGSFVYNTAESMLSSFERMFQRDVQQYLAPKRKVVPEKNKNLNGVHRNAPAMMRNEVDGKSLGEKSIEPVALSLPSSHKQPTSLPRITQTIMGKSLKAKGKGSNKRKMTVEEKAELRKNLRCMSSKVMEQVYYIVSKRNHSLMQGGNEFDICVEELDHETLWELDRLVSNHHKKEMKKRKEPKFGLDIITLEPEEDPKPKSPDKMPPQELTMENYKAGDSGEEYVDIGEDAPPDEFPPVEIERDPGGGSSGSSSSSSGGSSSSSDSDSDSSSESDSDDGSAKYRKIY